MSITTSLGTKDLWLTSAYGFSPESYGQHNFSNEKQRESFLNRTKSGTLIFVYITKNNGSEQLRGKLAGLLEVSHLKDEARSLMSEEEWRLHQQEPGSDDRWKHALRITRAWRVQTHDIRPVEDLFKHTYSPGRAQVIGSQGMPVNSDDVEILKKLRLKEVKVFGVDKELSPEIVRLSQLLEPNAESPTNTNNQFPPKFDFNVKTIKAACEHKSVPISKYKKPIPLTGSFTGTDVNSSSRTDWFLEFIHLLWTEMNKPSEIPFVFIDANEDVYYLDIGCAKYCFNNNFLSKDTDGNVASGEVRTLKILDGLFKFWEKNPIQDLSKNFSTRNGKTGPAPSGHQSASSRVLGEGYAYAFLLVGRETEMIKIGSSKDWKDRLKQLNNEIRPNVTGCSWKPYKFQKFPTERSAYEFEQDVIATFRDKNKLVEGENEIAFSTIKELDEIWLNTIVKQTQR